MADFGGFTVQTQSDRDAAQAALRKQVMISGSPQQQRAYNGENLLTTLFGDPQAVKQKQLEQRVMEAQKAVQPVAGDDAVTAEMRRLSAIRDAVADISPETSTQITTQLLKLGQQRLEQQKLTADTNRTVGEEQRDRELHPLAIQQKAADILEKTNKGQNYYNPKTQEIRNVAEMDSLERRALRGSGWIEITANLNAAKVGDLKADLTKPVETDLQKVMFDGQNQLDSMAAISQKYDPSFTTLGAELLAGGANAWERLGGKLPAEQAARLQQYAEWRRNSVDSFNRYIKYITGAAMSQKEAERIQKAFPDPEKDGDTQYRSKLRAVAGQIIAVQRRAQNALQHGLKVSGDQWEQVALPQVDDAAIDGMLGQQFGLKAAAPKPKAPAAAGPTPALSDEALVNKWGKK